MPFIDLETVRLPLEREAYAALELTCPGTKRRYVRPDGVAKRREILSHALLLSESMAPHVHATARAAMDALGVDDRIELFQSQARGIDSVRLVLYGDPIGIEFMGGYVDALDEPGLLAVIGHEIGHAIAHSGHEQFGWAMATCGHPDNPIKRTYAIAAEVTADRFGLLACRDIDAVLRLEMREAAGAAARFLQLDTRAYLEECQRVAEQTMANGRTLRGSTHPEHYIRGYAEWLFSETDLFQSLTGVGPGVRSLADVNETLRVLIGSLENQMASVVSAKPLPRAHDTEIAASKRKQDNSVDHPQGGSELLTSFANEVVFEGARKLVAAQTSLSTFARATVKRIAGLTADGTEASKPLPVSTDVDPLDEERRELLARFDELERRFKDE